MRLLDRYLLRELMVPLGYCLAGFLIVWITSDLFTDLADLREARLSVLEVVEYYWVRLPDLLGVVLPVALLLALLYALTNHSRYNELTAMRAAGQSLWRLAVPHLGVGLAFSLFLFGLTEWAMPDSAEKADAILKRHREARDGEPDPAWSPDLEFHNERDRRFWRMRAFHLDTGDMLDPYVEWTAPDSSRRRLLAERAERRDGVWTFEKVRLFVPGALPEWQQTNELAMPEFVETAAQIRSEIKISRITNLRSARKTQLTLSELIEYKRLHPDLKPRDRALIDTKLYSRLAHPWTCLVVVLIAVPFGAASARRNAFVGVAASIFICFSYFIIQSLGTALGIGGYLPPFAAAFLPNALFAALGIVLTARVR